MIRPTGRRDKRHIEPTHDHDEDEVKPREARQLINRQAEPARALVFVPVLQHRRRPNEQQGEGGEGPKRAPAVHSPEDRRQEAVGLAEAISLDVRGSQIVTIAHPKPATLFGSGKVEELKALIADANADLVIVDHAISPVQQRNLERAWMVKVLDRTGLILEIFGERARTREGRLQVELAHLSYQKGRLVRAWTHLERQRGGRGFLGGPGEAQIELDRRMLDERIIAIRAELEGVVRTRDLHRKGRRKVPYPVVAIVGYTNAGKSTLFNRVSRASVLAADQVFATLDPTMREVRLKSGRRIILSDTVGFISDLPTLLVAAFRATLEEVIEADLILHVRDVAHPETDAQARDVETVLGELGIDTVPATSHIVEVWNKVDLLEGEAREAVLAQARFREPSPVLTSAVTGEGLERLLDLIDARLGVADVVVTLAIPPAEGRLMHWLYENADVISQETDDDGVTKARVRIASEKKPKLLHELKKAGIAPL